MEAEFNHLNHATRECKYHVVFTPKYRKKLLFGKKTASGPSVSRSRTTEGVPDRGRTFDAGSCSHVDIDTSQIFGGLGCMCWKSGQAHECDGEKRMIDEKRRPRRMTA